MPRLIVAWLSHYFCKLRLFRIVLNTAGVQVTIFALDFRVNVMDENLNSFVAELAMRVETLEGQLLIMRPEFLQPNLILMVTVQNNLKQVNLFIPLFGDSM